VDLAWGPSEDDGGVVVYDIYRDAAKVGETWSTTFSDATVLPSSTYGYTVRARDGAGNQALSAPLLVTTPDSPGAFADGFESGNTSAWTTGRGLVVQTAEARSGNYAARGTSSDGRTFVAHDLTAASRDVTFQAAFRVISRSTTVNILRFQRGPGGGNIFTVFVHSRGFLAVRNDRTGATIQSPAPVDDGAWYVVRTHVVVDGSSSLVEVWLDGVLVSSVSGRQDLGTDPVGRVILGENGTGRTYDVVWDDAVVTTA
jgi:hypothetical protein